MMVVFDYLKHFANRFPSWDAENHCCGWYSKISVIQPSIPEIDPCTDDVERYRGSIADCLDCHQNFLFYRVVDCQIKKLERKKIVEITLRVQPSAAQIKQTIDAYRCNKYYNLGGGV